MLPDHPRVGVVEGGELVSAISDEVGDIVPQPTAKCERLDILLHDGKSADLEVAVVRDLVVRHIGSRGRRQVVFEFIDAVDACCEFQPFVRIRQLVFQRIGDIINDHIVLADGAGVDVVVNAAGEADIRYDAPFLNVETVLPPGLVFIEDLVAGDRGIIGKEIAQGGRDLFAYRIVKDEPARRCPGCRPGTWIRR